MRGFKYYFLRSIYKIGKRNYFNYCYYFFRGKLPKYSQPSNISEYILGNLLSGYYNKYFFLADKIEVRSYISSKGYGDYLPHVFKVWKNAEDIFIEDHFPDKFVLKMNNGCGNNLVVKDKKTLELALVRTKFKAWNVKTNMKYEPHYNLIEPQIFCEEFIEDYFDDFSSPIDYKFMCYKGKVKTILVCIDRDKSGNSVANSFTYSCNWEFLPHYLRIPKPDPKLQKPFNLEEMISIAEDLSKDFDFIRVDLYNSKRGIVFSELTFTPAMGILPTFSLEALENIYE